MAVGGALGALARHLVGGAPWRTLLINVTGSLALGWVLSRFAQVEWVRLLVGVGFLGAYTTMSAFAVETWDLGAWAAPYAAASVGGGVAAYLVGRRLA